MPIYQTATYQVKPAAVDAVRAAIETFVAYVADNEPGTKLYASWQQEDDPTRFVHLFIFENGDARVTHGSSDAVKEFEAVYRPELVGGPVVFTDYLQVATNGSEQHGEYETR